MGVLACPGLISWRSCAVEYGFSTFSGADINQLPGVARRWAATLDTRVSSVSRLLRREHSVTTHLQRRVPCYIFFWKGVEDTCALAPVAP